MTVDICLVTDDYRVTRGQQLRELRKASGLTLKDVTTRADVSKAYLCRIENGDVGQVNDEVLLRLAEVYDVGPEAVFVFPTSGAVAS